MNEFILMLVSDLSQINEGVEFLSAQSGLMLDRLGLLVDTIMSHFILRGE